MTTSRTLAHPPIKEAVLEVLFNFSTSPTLKLINEYGKSLADKYPLKDNLVTINANITNENTKVSRNEHGIVFHSQDRRTSIQIRTNGFAFAQTNESYKSWEEFKPLAFKELRSFMEFMVPETVNRFSLRFINEIKIPPSDDLKLYFTYLPNIDAINLPIRQLVSRVELEESTIGAIGIVSQLFSPPFNPDVNVYLDIDVIINNIPPLNVDMEYLSEKFDALRKFKNYIFFSSLTEKAISNYS